MDQRIMRGMNFCTTSGLLTATGGVTTHDTTVTINYVLNGKIATKTAITTGATPTTDYVTGDAITLTKNNGRTVVWGLISGGTVKVIAGPITEWDGTDWLNGAGAPDFPNIPDDFVPFAYQVIKGASTVSGTWTFGTNNWNATGITSTITNVAVLPDRPDRAV